MREALAGQTSGDGPIGRRVEARLAAPARRLAACSSRPRARTRSSSPSWRSASGPARRSSARRSPSSRARTRSCAWAPGPSSPTSRSARSASTPRTSSGASRPARPRSSRCTTPASRRTWRRSSASRAGAACASSRTPPRAWPRPGAGARSARSATPAASASTRRRTSPAARAARSLVADPELARRAEIAREKGTNRAAFFRGEVDKYTWVAEGSSYVLSDVLAALLEAQLDKLARSRRGGPRSWPRYREGLAGWAAERGVRLPPELAGARRRTTTSSTCSTRTARQRDEALRSLRARGDPGDVPLRPPALGSPRAHARRSTRELPVTDRVAATLLRLPLHPLLPDADVDRVSRRCGRRGARERRRPAPQPRARLLQRGRAPAGELRRDPRDARAGRAGRSRSSSSTT